MADPQYDFSLSDLLRFGSKPTQSFDMSQGMMNFNNNDMPSPTQNYLDTVRGQDLSEFDFQFMSGGNSTTNPGFMGKMLDWTDPKTGTQNSGWGMPALGAANGLFQSWIGLNQLNLAKKAFSEQKRQFNMNWDAQKTDFNRSLADRQQFRKEANPNNTEDVASYMSKWSIA